MYNPLLLTKSTTFIIGPVAQLLGYLMNGIYIVLDKIGIPNIGLAIILFTIVIYMCLLPLTIKQQKFSKLSAIMNPELKRIQDKYKNKKDNESMAAMQAETQAVYKKYGVSPSGSCVQLLIQMPILFALYRVIYNVPAYVTQVKEAFFPLVDNLIATSGSTDYLQATTSAAQFANQFKSDNFINGVGDTVANTFIDVLNRFSTADWSALAAQFPDLAGDVNNTVNTLSVYNNFLGLNIGNSPWYTLKQALASMSILGIIAAVAVPLLAAVTQLINVALMPQPAASNDPNDTASQMQNSMKTMNYMMPLMSAWFCFTLPAGMGLYWIAGSVIRSVQQVLINKHINNMDMDAYIARNVEKAKKKGDNPSLTDKMMSKVNGAAAEQASAPSRSIKESANVRTSKVGLDQAATTNSGKRYKTGSLSSKANMVRDYNEHKNN